MTAPLFAWDNTQARTQAEESARRLEAERVTAEFRAPLARTLRRLREQRTNATLWQEPEQKEMF